MKPSISLVKNSDQLLAELSELKEFKQRVEFAREHWKELGEGSSRTVFQISKSLIIKIAYNDWGLAQNSAEMRPSMQRSCVNGILVADPEGKWIITRFSEKVSNEKWQDVVGYPFDTFMRAIYWRFNNEQHEKLPRNYEEIIEHPLFKCLSELLLEEDPLQIGDVAKLSSWGLIDNEVKLRDFGLTKKLWYKFYKDQEDNSTSTI